MGESRTSECGAVWLCLFTLMSILNLGCGYADGQNASNSRRLIVRPQLDLNMPEGLAAIADGLYSEASADRAYAARQLGRLGGEGRPAAALLIDRLEDPDWQVRRQAAEALGAVGDTSAVEPLMEILADRNGDWSVRAAAARSLGQIGEPRAVEALVAVLNDMNAHVRHMAVIALGQIGTPNAAESLAAAARSDSDAATRFSAASALKQLESAPSADDSP